MNAARSHPSRFVRIWRWPLLLTLATLFGLFAALLGERSGWRVVSWAALSAPLATIMGCIGRVAVQSRRRESGKAKPEIRR